MPEIAGQVADSFADAVREHEEQWLSPLAVRSYETRGREAPEEECRLRTPFQRDRDRIVHSKAFRRLRHKTQVFVDPEGDHFRTRLTHTLEAAGISRGVARALRLNEDLTEAIAARARPRPPAVRPRRRGGARRALRERGGRRFRHNEHSLRIVERSSGTAAASTSRRGARRDPQPHRAGRAGDARGQDRPASSTASPTSTTTSTTRYGRDPLDPGDLPADEIAAARRRPARGASTPSSTTSSRPRRGRATSSRATRSARRCSRCARSCSSASTSAQRSTPSRRATRRSGGSSSTSPTSEGLDAEAVDRLPRRDDRPLRARLRGGARLGHGAHQGRVGRGVKAAVDIVAARRRTSSASAARAARYKGRCPFHEERTPSFSVTPARGTFYCFGCGEGGDVITFVREDREARLRRRDRVARRAASASQLEYEESSPEQEQKRAAERPAARVLERAAEFYARSSGRRTPGAGARDYLASRGLGEEVCREFRLGYAPGGRRLASQALRGGLSPGRS